MDTKVIIVGTSLLVVGAFAATGRNFGSVHNASSSHRR